MAEEITSPLTGKKYNWTKPPRFVHWRNGRIAQVYSTKFKEQQDIEGLADQERALRLFESMSAEEAQRLEVYINDVLRAGLGTAYPLTDIPDADYWWLWARSVYGSPDQKVETTEGETTAQAVENFSDESRIPSDGPDVPHLPVNVTRSEDGDSRSASA